MPFNVLHNALIEHQYEHAIHLSVKDPVLASEKHVSGDFPLQMAITKGAPPECILAIYNAYPDARFLKGKEIMIPTELLEKFNEIDAIDFRDEKEITSNFKKILKSETEFERRSESRISVNPFFEAVYTENEVGLQARRNSKRLSIVSNDSTESRRSIRGSKNFMRQSYNENKSSTRHQESILRRSSRSSRNSMRESYKERDDEKNLRFDLTEK